jgi:hypothetical protein
VATSTADRGFVGFVMMVLCVVVVVADCPYSFICCFVYFLFFFSVGSLLSSFVFFAYISI